MSNRGFFFLLLLPLAFNLSAEDGLEGALGYLSGNELMVSLATRIVESEDQTVWHMENTKLTLSGQSVNLKMSGENLVIFAQITPYIQTDQTLLLIATGEVFVSSAEEGTKYYSTLKSLPVSLGEKVLFFPLGMAVDANQNLYYIELEIQVLPRQSSDSASDEGEGIREE